MFFACVGRLTVAWAHLEAGLDMMVSITHQMGGHELEPERPRALKRKISYLRRFFRQLDMPDDGIANYDRLFREIETQSGTRHDIVHGILLSRAIDGGEHRLVRFLHRDNNLHQKPIAITSSNLLEAAKDAEALGGRTFKWVIDASDYISELCRSRGEKTQ